jgi:hypothetical protein
MDRRRLGCGIRCSSHEMDFVWRGHRFHRSTKCTSRREAEQVEREALEQAKRRISAQQTTSTSLLLDHPSIITATSM